MNEYGSDLALGTFKMPSLKSFCKKKHGKEKKQFESTIE